MRSMYPQENSSSLIIPNTIISTPADEMQYLVNAQTDMRQGYSGGYPGVLISGAVWLASAIVASFDAPERAVWTLLIGGVFIHPLAIFLNKILGASGTHTASNPLGKSAMEGTVFMMMMMPIALLLSYQKVEWFFEAMLLIIGGRYLTFGTLYGTNAYRLLGAGIAIAAFTLFYFATPAYVSIFTGAAIEITFGTVMLIATRKKYINSTSEN